MWTDSHCHLHDEEQPTALFERAVQAGVDRVVLIGTGESSSRRALETAGQLSALASPAVAYATVGQHPHDAKSGTSFVGDLLGRYRDEERIGGGSGQVVALGECGLDYFYEHSERDLQRSAFAEQIELARHYGLCLVVHTRQAWDDTFAVLEEAGVPERLVIHCFTGGEDEARHCLDLGAYLSFSGIVTFKNAGEVRAAALLCPEERLLVETDAPYLAPVPHRGGPNEPAFVAVVGEALASLREVTVEDLAATSSRNATTVFGLTG